MAGGTIGVAGIEDSEVLKTLFILGCVEVEATMGSTDDADDAKKY